MNDPQIHSDDGARCNEVVVGQNETGGGHNVFEGEADGWVHVGCFFDDGTEVRERLSCFLTNGEGEVGEVEFVLESFVDLEVLEGVVENGVESDACCVGADIPPKLNQCVTLR